MIIPTTMQRDNFAFFTLPTFRMSVPRAPVGRGLYFLETECPEVHYVSCKNFLNTKKFSVFFPSQKIFFEF